MSRQLLSQQQHYDWGLRALKTVLSIGGQLVYTAKQAGKKVNLLDQCGLDLITLPIDLAEETQMIIKALRVNTLSKLTFADSNRFKV